MLAHLIEMLDVNGELDVKSVRIGRETHEDVSLLAADHIGIEIAANDGARVFAAWPCVGALVIELAD